jgi:molybdenum cofactor cytidylyltransferase
MTEGRCERPVYAVLLAAGSSARMGEDKLLLEIGGLTVFEISLAHHLESALAGVCAVIPGWIGGFAGVAESCAGDRVVLVRMDGPSDMSDSVKAGWNWVMENTDAAGAMLSLADQPLISARTLDTLAEAFRSSEKPICAAAHRGRRGHPVVIARELGHLVMNLTGDMGARGILEANPDLVEKVEFESDEVVLDIDHAGDLEVMKARLSAGA